MSHLSPEVLAALIDEEPTPEQASHLSACATCRSELSAVRRVVALGAAERLRPGAPLTSWASLAGALQAEGVLKAPAASGLALLRGGVADNGAGGRGASGDDDVSVVRSIAPHYRAARPRWTRAAGLAAAAALLVTIGVAGGRWSAARAVGPAIATTAAPLGAGTGTSVPALQVRSPEEARAVLHTAEETYAQALSWLAANDSALAPRQIVGVSQAERRYRERLEVLDAAMSQARQALYEAPDDPVMNRYYMATMGAREVMLRRLTSVLPAAQQVVEY